MSQTTNEQRAAALLQKMVVAPRPTKADLLRRLEELTVASAAWQQSFRNSPTEEEARAEHDAWMTFKWRLESLVALVRESDVAKDFSLAEKLLMKHAIVAAQVLDWAYGPSKRAQLH